MDSGAVHLAAQSRPRTQTQDLSQVKDKEMESMAANDETLGGEEEESDPREHSTSSAYGSINTSVDAPSTHLSHSLRERVASRARAGTGITNSQGGISRSGGGTGGGAGGVTNDSGSTLRRAPSYYTPYMEDKLCRRLKFHFMGPHEKITARRRCPWKLFIQIIKIVLVTVQVIQFGYSRASLVEFIEKTTLSMKHMYLKNWDPGFETMPYPPATGIYAIYHYERIEEYINFTMQQVIQFGYSRFSLAEYIEKTTVSLKHLYLKDWDRSFETMPYPPATGIYAIYHVKNIEEHINFAMQQYDLTENIAIGSLKFLKNKNETHRRKITMCVQQYRNLTIDPEANKYQIDSTVDSDCHPIGAFEDGSYNITKYWLERYNLTIDRDRLLMVTMRFPLKSFRLDLNQKSSGPQLFKVDVTITMDDSNQDGQMKVDLVTDVIELDSSGHSSDDDAEHLRVIGRVALDICVILFTAMSILLCSRSVIRAQMLKREAMTFFKTRFGKGLSVTDQCEFLNLWYVTIIINDVLTLVGTGYKIQLETRNLKSSSGNFDICSIMLGTGSLLAWLGLLRYIGFFKQFNVLIITLKMAFPNILRFLLCTLLLYFGFMICGWAVLGPYHIKFRHISTASECLFSLLNGDDMFVTFSATVTKNTVIWYFSRIYLYLFISLYIYAVLNLFIAVILDSYETIKDYYTNGFPKSELFEFIERCQEPAHHPIYRQEASGCDPLHLLACCCRHPDRPSEYTSLVS